MLRLGEDVRASDAVVPKIPSFLEGSEASTFLTSRNSRFPAQKRSREE